MKHVIFAALVLLAALLFVALPLVVTGQIHIPTIN
mgnify:CR=1 FL=1